MSKLITSSKHNPCPICEKTNGNCRQGANDPDYWQCMTHAGTRKGIVINGYKCIGDTKDGAWAQFRVDNTAEWTQEQRDEWERERKLKAQQQAKEDQNRIKRALPPKERDKLNRRLLNALPLHPDDKADLTQRGFTPKEIELSKFKSVEPHQLLNGFKLDNRLPGVSRYGEKLTNQWSGYLCPIPDVDGFIVGCQIHLREPKEGQRYGWLSSSSNATLHLPLKDTNNRTVLELPIGVYRPLEKPKGIALTEGAGAKPFLTANRLDVIVVSSPGGMFSASPITLQNTLEKISKELGGIRELIIYPDGGDILNSQVMMRWERVTKLLQGWGWTVKFAWWGQTTKDNPDIDELTGNETINYLNINRLVAICRQNNELPEEKSIKGLPNQKTFISRSVNREIKRKVNKFFNKLKKVIDSPPTQPRLDFNCFKEENPELEEKIRQEQHKLRSLSYPADIKLNERYLPKELVHQLPKSGLIGIHAFKSAGKSTVLKQIIHEDKKQGTTILSITPRIALGREQAVKWEITWIDDYGIMQTKSSETTKQIEEILGKIDKIKVELASLEKPQQSNLWDNSSLEKLEQKKQELQDSIENYEQQIENLELASVNTLGLCWDSLWRTQNRDMSNSLIIIDEAELGLTHLATSSTCRHNRPHLLKTFADKIQECLTNGGRVIMSDADLSDVTIDYVKSLSEIPIKPFIVKNEYKGKDTQWAVDFRTGSRGETIDDIIKNIRQGYHLFITTDNRAEAKALETKILKEFPDFCIYIDEESGQISEGAKAGKPCLVNLNSKTAETKPGKDFLEHPNESIINIKPRIVISTPTMGVGVSIDETTQRLNELEVSIPYFDVVYGLFFGNIETSQCRQQLARVRATVPRIVWCKQFNRALEGCKSFFPDEIGRTLLKNHQTSLSIIDLAHALAGYNADDEAIRAEMLNLLNDCWDTESKCWKNPHLDLYTKIKARQNYSLWNLANLLKEELEDEGHKIICSTGNDSESTEELRELKDEDKRKEATKIAEAFLLDLEEAKKISSQAGTTAEDRYSAQKTLLADELPGLELTPEIIYKLITKDRRKYLNQLKLLWYMLNPEATKEIETENWLKQLKKFAKDIPYMPDIRTLCPKLKAIQNSGILDLIDLTNTEKIYQSNTDEVKAFLKRALKNKDILKTAFEITVTKDSEPIALINRILGKVGLKLTKMTKSHKDDRWRLNPEVVNDPDRLAVLKALDQKWQNRILTQTEQALQQGEEVPYNYKPEGSSPPNQIESQEVNVPQMTLAQDLAGAFEFCEAPEDLQNITEGVDPQVVDDAIGLYWVDPCKEREWNVPTRYQLREWQKQILDCQPPTQPKEWHWKELPVIGTIVKWCARWGSEKLTIKAIEPDGRCQLQGFGGMFWNSHIRRVMPASG